MLADCVEAVLADGVLSLDAVLAVEADVAVDAVLAESVLGVELL